MTDKVLKSLNIGDGNIYKPLPLVTSDDDGKILKVTGGEWGAGEVFAVTLISFYYSGKLYTAEKGMTWADYAASKYNALQMKIQGNDVYVEGAPIASTIVTASDIIIDGTTYEFY